MTVLERKARFARIILDEKFDEDILSELEWMLSVLSSSSSPCNYTSEELNARAEQGIKDAEQGYGKTVAMQTKSRKTT